VEAVFLEMGRRASAGLATFRLCLVEHFAVQPQLRNRNGALVEFAGAAVHATISRQLRQAGMTPPTSQSNWTALPVAGEYRLPVFFLLNRREVCHVTHEILCTLRSQV
jgi:hypothetical protein